MTALSAVDRMLPNQDPGAPASAGATATGARIGSIHVVAWEDPVGGGDGPRPAVGVRGDVLAAPPRPVGHLAPPTVGRPASRQPPKASTWNWRRRPGPSGWAAPVAADPPFVGRSSGAPATPSPAMPGPRPWRSVGGWRRSPSATSAGCRRRCRPAPPVGGRPPGTGPGRRAATGPAPGARPGDLGHDLAGLERRLLRLGIHPALAYESAEWASARRGQATAVADGGTAASEVAQR